MIDVKALLAKVLTWIKSKDYKAYGTGISLSGYTSSNNLYTCPEDGIIQLNCNYRANSHIMLYTSDGTIFAEAAAPGTTGLCGNTIITVPVYKGMSFYISRSNNYCYAYFIPLIT